MEKRKGKAAGQSRENGAFGVDVDDMVKRAVRASLKEYVLETAKREHEAERRLEELVLGPQFNERERALIEPAVQQSLKAMLEALHKSGLLLQSRESGGNFI